MSHRALSKHPDGTCVTGTNHINSFIHLLYPLSPALRVAGVLPGSIPAVIGRKFIGSLSQAHKER